MKALIVDDESHVRTTIRFLARWDQYGITEVLEAKNGLEAKTLITQESPEIIMTDVKMPKKNGIELIEWLEANQFPGKVIMISGYDDYDFMRTAFKLGCYDYLMKPIEEEMLNETLEGAVTAWKQEEEERHNMESGFYEEVRMFRLNREMTSACNGESFDEGEISLALPEAADGYDFTVIFFYHTHYPEPYIQLLAQEMVEQEWGNVFTLQNDPNVCLLLTTKGQITTVEEWITRYCELPVRLVSGPPIQSFEEISESFQAAYRSMAEQNFRTIHRLEEVDDAGRMNDIVAFVDKYYMEELSLDKLSARFFLSREHISRRFKQEVGKTLTSYVMDLRINQAKQWLIETEETMFSIASKLGYQDEIYFSKLFKKNVGLSPAEYRNKMRTSGVNDKGRLANS
ncbi:response regulator transcription factor [Paenibacillus vini]|uniref:DNA-binding response regulator n=1 Tax=Paenibacillus vini TaxID=1476024 RepID=A0ABQ4MAJ5_9BACL|nr:response regulator [Paenibacillus vini]GIP52989.1 hypothetical protein J42TS3_20240 [Paenibacillus vini]